MSADPRDVIARQLWAEQKDVDAFLSALSAAGWVVVKVPGNVKNLFGPERAQGHAEGWNAALAAVRASAVEVE